MLSQETEIVTAATSKEPRVVAEQIIWLRRDTETTPMHVLKLVYISHGWTLGLYGRSLINEPAEAWRYGPMVPSIYHLYKSFRGDPITTEPVDRSDAFDDEQRDVIEQVHDVYGDFTPAQLSALTHKPDTPWDVTYREFGVGAIIRNELLRDYYKRLAEQA